MGDDEWVNIDLKATEEELKEAVLRSTIKTLKHAHPDDLHFYVLERMLNCTEGSPGHRAWQDILKRIQDERNDDEPNSI